MSNSFEDMITIGFVGLPSITVGKTPFRKSYALMSVEPGSGIIETHAYFRNKEEAGKFLRVLLAMNRKRLVDGGAEKMREINDKYPKGTSDDK